MKKISFIKILSVALTACLLIALLAPTIAAVSAYIAELEPIRRLSDSHPSLEDVDIPKIDENPYDVKIEVTDYPIHNDNIYFSLLESGELNTVNTWDKFAIIPEGVSPYYTSSISPLYKFSTPSGRDIPSNLPYREGSKNIFHPDLMIDKYSIEVDPNEGPDLLALFPGANPDHLFLRVGATAVSGRTAIIAKRNDGTEVEQSLYTTVRDEAQSVYIDIPYNDVQNLDHIAYRLFDNGIITDTHISLIDNTSPSVTDVNIKKEGSQMILTLTFNEGLRWAFNSTNDRIVDKFYALVQLSSRKTLTMYLAGLGGENNNQIIFKGELGDYQYKNFSAEKIIGVVTPGISSSGRYGVVSLAEQVYYTPVNYFEYDHDIVPCWGTFLMYDSPITDFAGNPVYFDSVASHRLGVGYYPNSFEADEVVIYNDVTLGDDSEKIVGAPTEWPKDIDKTHMFAGPDNTLTVKINTTAQLTKKECSKVSIQLNIKNPDGTPVTAKCTSSYSFTKEYTVYGDDGGEALTCLVFEGIRLEEGMTVDVKDGEPPQIKVVTMTDEIENKTAYPYVKDPSRQLYADLTPPTVEATRLFMTEPQSNDGYYVLGVKTTVADVAENAPYYSGTLQTFADVSLGGKVTEATDARYIVSYDEISQSEVTDRLLKDGETTVIPINGEVHLKTLPIPSDRQNIFIYILISSGNKLVDDLKITVRAEDLVGNSAKNNVFDISCQIDEVAPAVTFPKSAKIEFLGDNDRARVTIPIAVSDYNDVVSVKYAFNEIPDDPTKWLDLVIDRGESVIAEIVTGEYGDLDQENKTYNEVVYVKAVDENGNESATKAYKFTVSTEKPTTDASLNSDPNIPTGKPEITVTGAPHASYDEELDAITRVTVTPTGGEWNYVTLVRTGETVDIFSFEGRQWYRVKYGTGESGSRIFETVEAIEVISEGFTLTETHGFYELFTHYGDLKISFENGYGNMTPTEGSEMFAAAASGSYMSDPNYYTVRYSARNPEQLLVNKVEFGQMIDMTEDGDVELTEDPESYLGYEVILKAANKGERAVLFNMSRKRINPMRGTQIYFTISNVIRSDWGMMDVSFERSYIELHRIDGDGDTVVNTVRGLAGTATQVYTVPDKNDDGSDFTTGQYYIRVYVVSNGGSESYYDSSSMVLDASVPENDGIWRYSYQLPFESYEWRDYSAEDKPFASVGVSVSSTSGETYRNRLLAAYSSGVTGLSIMLGTEISTATYEGITVGELEGIRYWNKLSAPSEEELEAFGFISQMYDESFFITTGFDSIYTEESIPKGAEGLLDGSGLYLVKGVNTICYQIKMTNGYVSPVKQATVIVTDKTPVLNIMVEDYVPSHYTYQGDHGITNAHSLKLGVESAYSLNGSGEVDVSVLSTYGMTVGKYSGEGADRVLDESFYPDPTPAYEQLDVIASGLGDEDYAIITKNTYTAQYPPENDNLCTAVFIAYDEYGGATVVAPQIGDHVRVDNWGGSTDYEYNINYDGGYADDPYTVGRNLTQTHTMYNQPVYYGKIVVGYQNLVSYDNGDWIVMEESNPDLSYNLFNIVTNDVTWGGGSHTHGIHNGMPGSMMTTPYSGVMYSETGKFPGDNFELINWDSAVITFSGGDLASPVTVPLEGGVANDAGYIEGSYWKDGDGIGHFSISVASVPLPEGKTIEDLPELDQLKGVDPETGEEFDVMGHFYRDFTIKGYNIYGDYFEKSGQVAVYYTEYGVFKYYERVEKSSVPEGTAYISDPDDPNYVFVPKYQEEMTGHGIDLQLGMETLESSNTVKTGSFENGEFRRTLTDYYGNEYELVHNLTEAPDNGTSVSISKIDKTAEPITVTIERSDGTPIFVDIIDYAIMSVEGNGTASVKVTVMENLRFAYRYNLGESDDEVFTVEVENIVRPEPKLVWSFDEKDVLVDEDGTRYRYGSVTVYLADANFTFVDKYSGNLPSFTFYPDGDTYYKFNASDIAAILGDETVTLDADVEVNLPISLRQTSDPLGLFDPITGERIEDTETPSIQILAYSNLNGYYAEKKLALQLEGARRSDAMNDIFGYEIFEYSGSRANANELLDEMGWATAYRFEIEISDRSRTRLFVKEGLYADAPDYDTGYSDSIEGVSLNSRLLDVTKAAEFTLFIVDVENNVTSVAFDVNNIGDAPVPGVAKVALSHELVRVYVIPPAEIDADTFSIQSFDQGVRVGREDNSESEYFGIPYVEYTDNDDYLINYSYVFNGAKVEGVVDASVIEINVDKVALVAGGLEWSSNKALEATTLDVTATLTFTHTISELKVTGEIDTEKVSFAISDNKVTVTYLDNHPQIQLICIAANGTRVPVILDAVENVDRTSPVIEVVSIELAKNGLSATITMRSNERAVFRQGGYVGELSEDGYYYYTRKVTENGTYTYQFADMSGLITEISVEVDVLVSEELEMLYSLSPDGSGAVSSPELLEIKIGDVIYIQPSRNVLVSFNGGEDIVADADEWTPITVNDTLGGYLPYIVAVDEYGNVLSQQFSKVQIPDGTPPVVSVLKHTYSVVVGTDRAEVEAALLANFNAYDDDAELTLKVVFTEDLSVSGITNVEYIAIDSAGNVGRAIGRLRVASGAEPWVYVNDQQTDRDASVILADGEQVRIKVDAGGRPFKIYVKEGVKTVAQMKIGSTAITSDYTATNEELSLGDLKSGTYYTVCVLTQDRDYFRIIIYVE